MKRRDLIRHLDEHGCQFLREGGNHTVYINPTARKIPTVPRHPALPALPAPRDHSIPGGVNRPSAASQPPSA